MQANDARGAGAAPPPAAFYCVADERYFLGAVALLNSLRLVGHREPVFVLDSGLAERQRELLAAQATVVERPRDAPPWLSKTVAPLRHPAELICLLDVDMIAVRTLAPLFDRAAAGELVAFRDPIERFVPEWGELLGRGVARRLPYVSSAAVCLPAAPGADLLGELAQAQQAVDFERTFWRANDPDYPFLYGDQDVLNALLASGEHGERLAALEARLAATPPYAGLRLGDEGRLECRYADGESPFLLHQYLPSKPWLRPAHDGVYQRLLRRLLVGPGLAIEVPRAEVPRWLRSGALARAERSLVNARERLRWHLGEPAAARARAVRKAARR